ncbi:MAG: hypothetical protein AVDCRST_MAG25-1814, partial [uncultured Rubrobacteraceae bacterium]
AARSNRRQLRGKGGPRHGGGERAGCGDGPPARRGRRSGGAGRHEQGGRGRGGRVLRGPGAVHGPDGRAFHLGRGGGRARERGAGRHPRKLRGARLHQERAGADARGVGQRSQREPEGAVASREAPDARDDGAGVRPDPERSLDRRQEGLGERGRLRLLKARPARPHPGPPLRGAPERRPGDGRRAGRDAHQLLRRPRPAAPAGEPAAPRDRRQEHPVHALPAPRLRDPRARSHPHDGDLVPV